MAIRNVTSTLPDEPYIRALETDRDDLWAIVQQLRRDVQNLQRGQA